MLDIEAHADWAELVDGLGVDEKTLYLIVVGPAPVFTTGYVAIGFTGTDDDARRAEAEVEKRWFDREAEGSSKGIASTYKEDAAAHRHNAIYFADAGGWLNEPLQREIESCLRRGLASSK